MILRFPLFGCTIKIITVSRSNREILIELRPSDADIFALIDELELVPCRFRCSDSEFFERQHRAISSLLREERDNFLRQLYKRRYVRSTDCSDLFGTIE